jgi:hypothetical protein
LKGKRTRGDDKALKLRDSKKSSFRYIHPETAKKKKLHFTKVSFTTFL